MSRATSATSATRVYIPATLAMVQSMVDSGELVAVGGTAFALTPSLRESYASGDTEELEYVAMMEAARCSLRLLSAELDADRGENADGGENDGGENDGGKNKVMLRRVVVAADVAGVRLRPDLDRAAVTLPGPVPTAAVAAVHVDLAEAEEPVRAAAAVIDAADLGDPDAEFLLGDVEDHQMAWYHPRELPFLLDLL